LGDDPAHALSGLLAVGIDLDRRAETLTLHEFYSLADFLKVLLPVGA
jgi:hypothetical protein